MSKPFLDDEEIELRRPPADGYSYYKEFGRAIADTATREAIKWTYLKLAKATAGFIRSADLALLDEVEAMIDEEDKP